MSLEYISMARRYGPTPAEELLTWLDELTAEGLRQTWVDKSRAHVLAMVGRLDEARAILAELRHRLAERGAAVALSSTVDRSVQTALLAADYETAVVLAREHCRLMEEEGDLGALATSRTYLAQALYGLGRLDDAEAEARQAAALGARDDVLTQMVWRQVTSKVLACRGEYDQAERLAREAVGLAQPTDGIVEKGDAWADLAEVLERAGKHDEAADALEQAVALYERKGSIASVESVRSRFKGMKVGSVRTSIASIKPSSS
jgi:tetratricopeptide (TPR) repeat protein